MDGGKAAGPVLVAERLEPGLLGWYPRPDSNRRYRRERAAC
jgi:hypothetical protein